MAFLEMTTSHVLLLGHSFSGSPLHYPKHRPIVCRLCDDNMAELGQPVLFNLLLSMVKCTNQLKVRLFDRHLRLTMVYRIECEAYASHYP
jgi:hypothetical protein